MVEGGFPRYGDIYDVDFDPVVGSEIGKRRPALIVSNDFNNQYSATVTVIPITGRPTTKRYPFEVLVPREIAGLDRDSRMKVDQIRTVDKRRLAKYRGSLPPEYFPQAEKALRIHLNIK